MARKRDAQGSWEERVRAAFRSVLTAASKLEVEPSLKVRFSTRAVRFRINDRLLAPNASDTLPAVAQSLRAALEPVYGGAVELEPSAENAGELFTATIKAAIEPRVAQLLERL